MDKKDKTALVLIIFLIILSISLILFANKVEKFDKETIYIEHIVFKNQNLSIIAQTYYPELYLLKAIHKIKKDNGLVESDLQVGQVLLIEKEVD